MQLEIAQKSTPLSRALLIFVCRSLHVLSKAKGWARSTRTLHDLCYVEAAPQIISSLPPTLFAWKTERVMEEKVLSECAAQGNLQVGLLLSLARCSSGPLHLFFSLIIHCLSSCPFTTPPKATFGLLPEPFRAELESNPALAHYSLDIHVVRQLVALSPVRLSLTRSDALWLVRLGQRLNASYRQGLAVVVMRAGHGDLVEDWIAPDTSDFTVAIQVRSESLVQSFLKAGLRPFEHDLETALVPPIPPLLLDASSRRP